MQCVDLGGRRIIKKIFFKQKTAYEISLGLVGSEMCIRDRILPHFSLLFLTSYPYGHLQNFAVGCCVSLKHLAITSMHDVSSEQNALFAFASAHVL